MRFGKTARLNSAADLDIEASQVAGRDGVLLEAGGNIAVTSRAETKSLHGGRLKQPVLFQRDRMRRVLMR